MWPHRSPQGPMGPHGAPWAPWGAPWGPMGPLQPPIPNSPESMGHVCGTASIYPRRRAHNEFLLFLRMCLPLHPDRKIARPSIMVGIHVRWCHELGLSIKCPRACAPRSPNFNVGMIEAPRGSLTRQEKNNRFCSGRSSKLVGNIEIGGAGGHDPVQRAPQPFISDTMVASCL